MRFGTDEAVQADRWQQNGLEGIESVFFPHLDSTKAWRGITTSAKVNVNTAVVNIFLPVKTTVYVTDIQFGSCVSQTEVHR